MSKKQNKDMQYHCAECATEWTGSNPNNSLVRCQCGSLAVLEKPLNEQVPYSERRRTPRPLVFHEVHLEAGLFGDTIAGLQNEIARLRGALEAIRDMADKRPAKIRMPDGRGLDTFIRLVLAK